MRAMRSSAGRFGGTPLDKGDNVANATTAIRTYIPRFVDGWFDTCDIAKFDDDGYLYLVGRRTEVIFVGGFKVYAQEVEKVLLEHPAVAEAAVIGVPRSISGEIVKAFIVLKKDEKATSKDLIEHCKKKLSYYKVPRIIDFLSEMPRSSIGEILKRKLEKE